MRHSILLAFLVCSLCLLSPLPLVIGEEHDDEWIAPVFVESLDEIHPTHQPILRTAIARSWNRVTTNHLSPVKHESDPIEHHSFAESSAELASTLEARLSATVTAEGKSHAELLAEIELRGPAFWEAFKAKFPRSYRDEKSRFATFMNNLVTIAKLNAQAIFSKIKRQSRAVYSHLTPHADRTPEEFKALLNAKPVSHQNIPILPPTTTASTNRVNAGHPILRSFLAHKTKRTNLIEMSNEVMTGNAHPICTHTLTDTTPPTNYPGVCMTIDECLATQDNAPYDNPLCGPIGSTSGCCVNPQTRVRPQPPNTPTIPTGGTCSIDDGNEISVGTCMSAQKCTASSTDANMAAPMPGSACSAQDQCCITMLANTHPKPSPQPMKPPVTPITPTGGACTVDDGQNLLVGTCMVPHNCDMLSTDANMASAMTANACGQDNACCIQSSQNMDPKPSPKSQPTPHAPSSPPVAPPQAPTKPTGPVDVDWRAKSTPIKDSKTCASSYAFTATEVLESAWARKTGQILVLSPQQLMGCFKGLQGCGGGSPLEALQFSSTHGGAVLEQTSPYVNQPSGSCVLPNLTPPIKPLTVGLAITTPAGGVPDENLLGQQLSTYGPLVTQIDATNFQFYSGGIIDNQSMQCSTTRSNWDIVIEGLGTDKLSGQRYWIIRNSWNESWGEKGRAKLAFGGNTCGLANTPVGITV